jgi:hypothetical protein
MADSEFLRQKREREFQQRVLSAVEKPKESRAWKFVNSGIFLWGLSVAVITIGGGYITNHQQCMRDADRLIERREHLTREIWARKLAFERAVADAKSIQEAPFFPDTRGSYFFELAKIATPDLESELMKLRFRVMYAELPLREISDARDAWIHFNETQSDFDQAALQTEREGPEASGNPDLFLKIHKAQAKLSVAYDSFNRDVDIYAYNFVPNCSVENTFRTALGYSPPIVFASVSPVLSLAGSDFKKFFRDEIARIEKLQSAINILRAEEAKPKEW